MTDSPIFVVGCPRSGTTMLQLMLHAHPRIAIPPETRFLLTAYWERRTFGDLTVPANQVRMDAVERLVKVADEAGLSLIQLALGFVTAHPGVTSAIIGPRTVDHLHSQLAAADTVLSADVLDAIDAIVAPGVDLAAAEKLDTPPALLDPANRRR